MRGIAAVTALSIAFVVVACGGDEDGGGNWENDQIALAPVDIRGEIKELQAPGPDGILGAFLAEGELAADTRYERAWVRVKETTAIWRKQGAATVKATVADLQPGIVVEIMFEGVVAELNPVQASAGEITILD